RYALGVDEDLSFDDRKRLRDTLHHTQTLGDRVVIRDATEHLHHGVAVEAEDGAEQLRTEAVHHAHHDDQRRDAQRGADQREAGDDGDEALLALRAQITARDEPFET